METLINTILKNLYIINFSKTNFHMGINNKKNFRTIKFLFFEEKKYVKMDVNTIVSLRYLKKVFAKLLKNDYTKKNIEFSCKNQILDQFPSISVNLKRINESDDSTEQLEISVRSI